jgi:hypothetical protein
LSNGTDRASEGLHIWAITMTNALVKLVEGKIVPCVEEILAVSELFLYHNALLIELAKDASRLMSFAQRLSELDPYGRSAQIYP